MLNEDNKVSHRSHVILTAVKKRHGVRIKENDERLLKEIKRVLATALAQEQEIDRKVKAKLASYSRTSLRAVLNGTCSIARRSRKKRENAHDR